MTIDTHHHMLPDFSGRRRRTVTLLSAGLRRDSRGVAPRGAELA
jgi:hypothetical protein